MNVAAFENLELIPQLLDEIKNLKSRLDKFTPKLNNKKAVINFLDISSATYYNYINQDIIKENIHFYKKDGKIIFIEDAIIDLRNNISKGRL